MTQSNSDQAGAVPPWAAGASERMHELDPELNEQQIELVKSYGKSQSFEANEALWSAGDRSPMMLVLRGSIDVLRRECDEYTVIISHGPGHYVGETITMSGGRAMVYGRAGAEGLDAVVIQPDQLRQMIATESDLGETLLLSFILRRMRMIAENLGDVSLIGNPGLPLTGDLQSFLSRNGVPFQLISPISDEAKTQHILEAHGLNTDDLPVLICNDVVLTNPSNRDVAECLGFTAETDFDKEYDLAVIGSGPAGLAAAVYAASEGLSVIVIERCAPGGQAGSSSKIENYMGFPTGISGQALMGRGYLQAQKFGAQIVIARNIEELVCGSEFHQLRLDGGDDLKARSVVIASGAVYRQPEIDGLEKFAGVHYGASHIEAQMCRQRNVAIIGGGNSAGQAAVYLSKYAKQVTILIRGDNLASSMSEYLIQRINRLPNVTLMPHTEVVSAHGDEKLESVTVINNQTKDHSEIDVSDMFIFIGVKAGSEFAEGTIALDDRGFILTGDDLKAETLTQFAWPLDRQPYLLETSCPRVFAAGDVRSSSVKRVASAVGEGSVSIQFVHTVLADPH